MLSRFFHVRFALKPFAAPAVRITIEPGQAAAAEAVSACHADYDRCSLQTQGFDHYVEWNEDNDRFVVH